MFQFIKYLYMILKMLMQFILEFWLEVCAYWAFFGLENTLEKSISISSCLILFLKFFPGDRIKSTIFRRQKATGIFNDISYPGERDKNRVIVGSRNGKYRNMVIN